jgi:putative iron-dependent peroxidase
LLRAGAADLPFGRVGPEEFGTFYVAYAKTPAVTERMLENTFLGLGEADHDRLLDSSTALTGNLYFVPSADFLDGPTIPAEDADDASPPILRRRAMTPWASAASSPDATRRVFGPSTGKLIGGTGIPI